MKQLWNWDETCLSFGYNLSDASLSMVAICSNDLPKIDILSQLTVYSLFIQEEGD